MQSTARLTPRQQKELVMWGALTLLLLVVPEFIVFKWWCQLFDVRVLALLLLIVWDGTLLVLILSVHWQHLQTSQLLAELKQIKLTDIPQRLVSLPQNKDLSTIARHINQVLISMMQQAKHQQQANQTQREFIANISHDLRTPLTSIVGFLGLMEQQPQLPQQQMQKYIHIAYQKAQQLQSLINDLFEYTTTTTASIHLHWQNLDMVQMVEQLAAEFELQAQKQQVQIVTQTPAHPIIIQADTEKLGRVFNNLIMNALKYGRGARHLWLQVQDAAQVVQVTVANDGVSIDPQNQQHLFERFYQSSANGSGSGLGLAIAKNLIMLHHGQISVQSNQRLTQFKVVLPKNKHAHEGD